MENNRKKQKRPMEILWGCMALVCLITAISRNVNFGFAEARVMYGLAGASLLMLAWRRSLRKKEENNGNDAK